ncbi:hypothetical protein SCLCIDRAFT_495119 [Scleroderma citrinum Foug A]|uniref:Uncharacterized protein n=1 Tax=Scleroderma citrinum Foug A TaxID=1036808 RepID=A0A0C3A8C2_9AGAM|nr:hypothetical protein SCLCIDRAFT_495119 [Scleroderma citrinum Foug A]
MYAGSGSFIQATYFSHTIGTDLITSSNVNAYGPRTVNDDNPITSTIDNNPTTDNKSTTTPPMTSMAKATTTTNIDADHHHQHHRRRPPHNDVNGHGGNNVST